MSTEVLGICHWLNSPYSFLVTFSFLQRQKKWSLRASSLCRMFLCLLVPWSLSLPFLCSYVSFFPSAFSSSSTHFLWVSSPPPPSFHLLKRSATKLTCNYTSSEITPTLTAALLSIKANTPVKLMGWGNSPLSQTGCQPSQVDITVASQVFRGQGPLLVA